MEFPLLLHQRNFVKIFLNEYSVWALAIVSGFGAGKSYTLAATAVLLLLKFPGKNVGVYSITYDLIKLINIPQIIMLLEKFGLEYSLNKVDKIITVSGLGQIIMRSLDNPASIIGYEHGNCLVDELDTLPKNKAQDAWNKIIARNRQLLPEPNRNKVGVFTTPEGFRFVYDKWERSKTDGYALIKARTRDNKYLPKEYVQNLIDTYPPQLIEAYLNGEFVNLNGAQVYSNFNRETCHSSEIVEEDDILYIGTDFNIEHMAGIVFVERANKNKIEYHAVDEFIDLFDTASLVSAIRSKYPERKIYAYPDASGSRRTSNSTTSDHAQLRLGNFKIRAFAKNSLIKDRIAATNKAFKDSVLFVNTITCPRYTECLEQLPYDKNGVPDKTTGLDHPTDAGDYFINYVRPIKKREALLRAVAQ